MPSEVLFGVLHNLFELEKVSTFFLELNAYFVFIDFSDSCSVLYLSFSFFNMMDGQFEMLLTELWSTISGSVLS